MVYKIWFDASKIYTQTPDLTLKSLNVISVENRDLPRLLEGETIEMRVLGDVEYKRYRVMMARPRVELNSPSSEPGFNFWMVIVLEELKP